MTDAARSSPVTTGDTAKPVSIVRRNLMERPGYTPYCGSAERCTRGMPRTRFDGSQFGCACGWRSNFEAEFIEQYKQKNPGAGQ